VDAHRFHDVALVGRDVLAEIGQDDVADGAQGFALLDLDDRGALDPKHALRVILNETRLQGAGAGGDGQFVQLRRHVAVDEPHRIFTRCARPHLGQVDRVDRFGFLAGFFRHGNQSVGVEDAQSFAGSGSANRQVLALEREFLAKELANFLAHERHIPHHLAGRVKQAGQFGRLDADFGEFCFRSGQLAKFRIGIYPDSAAA